MRTRQATERCALRRSAAFTLVEMLVVIAIIGIVAGMSVMAFGPFLRGQTLSQAASTVQSSIWEARNYAATHRTKATLYFDTDEGRLLLFKKPADADDYANDTIPPENKPEPVSKPEFLSESVTLVTTDLGADSDKPVVILDNLTPPLQIKGGSTAMDRLVFHPGGSLDPQNMNSTSNWYVVLQDKRGDQMAIEVIFASGLTRMHEL